MSPAAPSGPAPTSRRCGTRKATRRSSPRRGPSSACASATSTPIPRSWCRRRTTSSCGASTSPTVPASAAPSNSPAMPRWCWPRRSAMRCTRRSATCSCRPSCWSRCRRSSVPVGRAPARKWRPGCATCWRRTRSTSTRSPTKPTAGASSAVAAASSIRRRWTPRRTGRACSPTAPARCSIRSWRSAAASPSIPTSRRRST
ncbi:hypothetical protein D3C78_567110 [compost metagenome]